MKRKSTLIPLLTLLFIFVLSIFTEEIHEASAKGDLERVKNMLRINPALLNMVDKTKNTPLHYAASSGKLEVVKFLIKKGADLQAKNTYGWTALHSSSYNGYTSISELLITNGINIEDTDIFGWPPLFRAIQGGHKSMIEFLVERGANINATDRDGQTPLYLSVVKGEKEIVEYLLKKDAKRALNKGDNETLLHLAASIGIVEIVDLLLKKGENINAKKRFSITPLHLAAAFGNKEVIEFLIDNGADVNAVSKVAGTPIFQAMVANQQEIVRILSARGADKKRWKFPVLKGDYLGQIKPGLKPKVFAPGILINVYRPHGPINISPDGKEMYWPASGTYGREQRIFCIKQENGIWKPPSIASFSTDAIWGGPFVSHDGKRLFFQSKRQSNLKEKPRRDSDLWVVDRIADHWGEPRKLGSEINTKFNEVFPSISKKGNLFFQANYPDKSMGGWDIYMAKITNGQYSEPINMGPNVNGSFSDCVPCISPDESYIVFHSSRPGGFNEGHELYISFKKRDGTWTKAKNMGKAINIKDAIISGPYVSPDGKFLFFTRRQTGVFEYCWVSTKIIEELKPKELK